MAATVAFESKFPQGLSRLQFRNRLEVPRALRVRWYTPAFRKEVIKMATRVCTWPKAVHVNSYWRYRFGRWEQVCEHCRSYPT